jgi:hypothetical protein
MTSAVTWNSKPVVSAVKEDVLLSVFFSDDQSFFLVTAAKIASKSELIAKAAPAHADSRSHAKAHQKSRASKAIESEAQGAQAGILLYSKKVPMKWLKRKAKSVSSSACAREFLMNIVAEKDGFTWHNALLLMTDDADKSRSVLMSTPVKRRVVKDARRTSTSSKASRKSQKFSPSLVPSTDSDSSSGDGDGDAAGDTDAVHELDAEEAKEPVARTEYVPGGCGRSDGTGDGYGYSPAAKAKGKSRRKTKTQNGRDGEDERVMLLTILRDGIYVTSLRLRRDETAAHLSMLPTSLLGEGVRSSQTLFDALLDKKRIRKGKRPSHRVKEERHKRALEFESRASQYCTFDGDARDADFRSETDTDHSRSCGDEYDFLFSPTFEESDDDAHQIRVHYERYSGYEFCDTSKSLTEMTSDEDGELHDFEGPDYESEGAEDIELLQDGGDADRALKGRSRSSKVMMLAADEEGKCSLEKLNDEQLLQQFRDAVMCDVPEYELPGVHPYVVNQPTTEGSFWFRGWSTALGSMFS